MEGYFKPKFESQRKELHVLELDDCDFISDDEVILHPVFGQNHSCPRCGAITRITGNDPYCSDCNWDSLTDPFSERQRCAA